MKRSRIAIMVVVDRRCETYRSEPCRALDSAPVRRHILERSIFLVVLEARRPLRANCDIRKAIVIVITRWCSQSHADAGSKSCLLRNVFKFATAQVVVQRTSALRTPLSAQERSIAVVIVVEKARARAKESGKP